MQISISPRTVFSVPCDCYAKQDLFLKAALTVLTEDMESFLYEVKTEHRLINLIKD
jgi:hypothetical protein